MVDRSKEARPPQHCAGQMTAAEFAAGVGDRLAIKNKTLISI